MNLNFVFILEGFVVGYEVVRPPRAEATCPSCDGREFIAAVSDVAGKRQDVARCRKCGLIVAQVDDGYINDLLMLDMNQN